MILLAVVVVALALRLAFSAASFTNLPPTGDESLIFLVATQVAAGQWPLLISGTPYQFPVESYLAAPFTEWLPRNAFGVRSLTLIFGGLTVWLLVRTALRIFPNGVRWPSVLLLLFPSTYWLMIQSGYPPPGYPTMLLMFAVTAWLLVRNSGQRLSSTAALVMGLAGGIAFSAHMSALSFIGAAFLVVIFGPNVRDGLRAGAFLIFGLILGAGPVFLSMVIHSGAHEAVSGTVPIKSMLSRLWNPVLLETLPGAMGVDAPLFPDFRRHLDYPRELRMVFSMAYLALVIPLVGYRMVNVTRDLIKRRWVTLDWIDFFILASFFAIGLTALSARAQAHSYRYLLISVVSFPFLVGYGFQHVRPFLKYVIGLGVAGAVLFNVLSSAHLIKWWQQPPFAAQVAATPRIDGLIQELKQMGVDRCYASYWHAYRILFESNGDVVCAQPYNERFLGWPVPNKVLIDEAPDARFVLTTGYDSRFPVQAFTRHMQEYGIRYKKTDVGVFSVFGDFEHDQVNNDSLVPLSTIILRSNAGEEGLDKLLDADSLSFWSSVDQQQPGVLVEAMLDQPRVIHRVTLHFPFIYPEKPKGHSHSVDIQGLVEGNWITLVDDHPHRFDRLRFLNGHPVYGGMNQTIWFSPRRVKGLRVVINRPNPKRKWVLSGVELGEQRSGAFQ